MSFCPYTLTITEADADTIAFVGRRCAWSEALLAYGSGTHEMTETEAWELSDAIESDDAWLPMLDPYSDLYRRLTDFVYSIV